MSKLIVKCYYFIKSECSVVTPPRRMIRFSMFLLKFLGIRNDTRSLWLRQGVFVLEMFTLMYYCLPEMTFALQETASVAKMIEALTLAISTLLPQLKYLQLFFTQKNVMKLIGQLQADWKKCVVKRRKPERVVWFTNIKTQRLIMIYTMVVYLITFLHTTIPMWKMIGRKIRGLPINELLLPHAATYFLDTSKNPGYSIVYTVTLITMNYIVFACAGGDTLFIALSLHVVAQMKLLRRKVSTIGINFDPKTKFNRPYLTEDKAMEQLKRCIARHNVIIEYVEMLRVTFGIQLLIQYLSSSVSLCLTLFKILKNLSHLKEHVPWFVYLVILSLQFYTWAWCGQQIINENHLLSDAAYNCPWYEFGPRFRKSLILLMQRAQKPLGIRTAQFYMVSVASYGRIMRAAVSYFTFLQNIVRKKN